MLAALAEDQTYVGRCEQPVTPAPEIGCLWAPKTPALVSTLSYTYTHLKIKTDLFCVCMCVSEWMYVCAGAGGGQKIPWSWCSRLW